MKPWIKLAVAATAAASAFLPTLATAQNRVEAGVLTCEVAPGIGLLIASSKALTCSYNRGPGQPVERYTGRITKVGLDIGITGPGVIAWAVLGPSNAFPAGALAGTYSGVSAQATAVVGLGANALIGGSNRTFVLQPLSISAQTGINLAVGIASVELFPG